MACPTCDATMQCLGTLEGRTHYWCPRCGTLRMKSGEFVHDEGPKVVKCLRSFYGMISDNDAGRALRTLAQLDGIPECVLKPADRPKPEGA